MISIAGAGALKALTGGIAKRVIIAGNRRPDQAKGTVRPERQKGAPHAHGKGSLERQADQIGLHPVQLDRRHPARLQHETRRQAQSGSGARECEEQVGVVRPFSRSAGGGRPELRINAG